MFGPASWAPGVRPAPPITGLSDQDSRPFSLAALRGHTVAVVFFDSHCHQECPLEGHALAAAERQLPASQRPVLVAVSVNPQDTRASVASAVRAWGLAGLAPWYWLMGARRQLRPAWRAYHIYVGPKVHGDIAHTEAVYLIDKRGYERSAYLYPFMPGFVRHDLRQLAAGASGRA
jgi:cytochrome oxidase Cu insertion factor (SCO1/SenC/PrrC family)